MKLALCVSKEFKTAVLVVMILVHHTSAQCSISLGAGAGRSVTGLVATCSAADACKSATISGCEAVFCTVAKACDSAIINGISSPGTTYVQCTGGTGGNAACAKADITATCLQCGTGACGNGNGNYAEFRQSVSDSFVFATSSYQGNCDSAPSSRPSGKPSSRPSSSPSAKPSKAPSSTPSSLPSSTPSLQPSGAPSTAPSSTPSQSSMPSTMPSFRPSRPPQEQSIPTASSDPKKTACFSALNTVHVEGKGTVPLTSLKIGDTVKTGSNKVARVLSFMHMDPNAEVEYLQIYMDSLKAPLEISRDHFLVLQDGQKIVRAEDVQVGDALLSGNHVVAIDSVQRRGLYAPVTEDGEIQVSGITASCYINLLDGVAPVVQAVASHAALAPLRLACAWDFSICKNEKYTEADGFSTNLLGTIRLGLEFVNLKSGVQILVLFVGLPLLAGLFVVDSLLIIGLLAAILAIVRLTSTHKFFSKKLKTL